MCMRNFFLMFKLKKKKKNLPIYIYFYIYLFIYLQLFKKEKDIGRQIINQFKFKSHVPKCNTPS